MIAEATIRDKYHKCFTCNLTGVPSKIYKIRTRLKVKVCRTEMVSLHFNYF